MNSKQLGGLVLTILSVSVLNGCGGGGGGGSSPTPTPIGTSTITGVAAVGAPINGGTVSIISSTGELIGTATTSATGNYSITYAANKVGPFLIEVSGGTYIESTTGIIKNGPKLHSIADVPGTANITPLTEMVVTQSLPAGQIPTVVFANCQTASQSGTGVGTSCTPNFATLTSSNVSAAQNSLINTLGSAITAVGGGITDFIHQTFLANSATPMDKLLDVTKPTITVVGNVPTIALNTPNGAYSFGLTSSGVTAPSGLTVSASGVVAIPNFASSVAATANQVATLAPNLATAASELAQIQTQMNGLANLFSTGIPSQVSIAAKLHAGFLMDGMNAAIYAQQLATAPSAVAPGDTFVVTLATLFDNLGQSNSVAGTKWVNATQFNAAGAIVGESRVKFISSGGTWLMAGNERTVLMSMRSESAMTSALAASATASSNGAGTTVYTYTSAVPATFTSDVNFSVDPTSAATNGVASAWVTGANIVASSVSGVPVYNNSTPATPITAVVNRQIPLCDAVIVTDCTNAVDGSEYTITLKSAAGNVIATYKDGLKKAPIPKATLNASMFPVIGVTTPVSIGSVVPSGPLSLVWTTPTGLTSNWVDFTVWDSNGVLVFQQSGVPSGNTFTGTLPAFTPPGIGSGVALSRFEVAVQAADVYGRQYITFK